MRSRTARAASARCGSRPALVLAFIYVPLVVIVALRVQRAAGSQAWPPTGFTLDWFGEAARQPGRAQRVRDLAHGRARRDRHRARARHARRAGGRSATASSAARRSRSCVVLPIALPGIVTGIALQTHVHARSASTLGLLTIIIGHATFCVVVVYNNVIARLRRTAAIARGGVGGPRRRHLRRRSATSRSRRCARRCSPARCSPSRCRSTRSSSRTSRPAAAPDAADLDLQQLPAPEPAAARQRGGRPGDPAVRSIPVYLASRLSGRDRGADART